MNKEDEGKVWDKNSGGKEKALHLKMQKVCVQTEVPSKNHG